MSSDKVHVEHCKGVNGLDKVILREIRHCSAEVYLYGGQVTSWKNALGEELLFLSSKEGRVEMIITCTYLLIQMKLQKLPKAPGIHLNETINATFRPPRTIRGGISICFPQAFVDLILRSSEEDMKIWPRRYECRLRVALGPTGDLMLTSRIRNTNTDGKPFTFRFAYQTYLFVTDISEVRVEGLETLDYLDNLMNRERFTEQEDAITFESEVDKVYLSTPTKIAILDHDRKRTLELRKDGLPDAGMQPCLDVRLTVRFRYFAVVWNPWDKKAKAMADFGDDEYTKMLCVEAACVEEPINLKPGEEWKGRQEISAVPSSYCSEQLDLRRLLLSG
ncbi:putative glucose-6-phosphate 1-epimerase [Hibiscus syriacus]|uniref:glucose-6-phosphate 1-epimerase n=1 Tax=Hibiscus syriacus TaxID=106335 RepID=A0A6A3D547_HIBSY|nr:putative glucose-6-phosphate 1-epimerase [Hibiscus syriacus]